MYHPPLARLPGQRIPIVPATPYVSRLHGVERVRIRMRLRRARPDLVSLYLSAGIAGVVCGFLFSVLG